jgi:hypothetical protein
LLRAASDFRPDVVAAPIDCGTATTILPPIVSAGLRRHLGASVAETEVGRTAGPLARLSVRVLHPGQPTLLRQPTEPSIWIWIRRFISTAYSSGSSLTIGSMKPATIIAEASDWDSPRDMR